MATIVQDMMQKVTVEMAIVKKAMIYALCPMYNPGKVRPILLCSGRSLLQFMWIIMYFVRHNHCTHADNTENLHQQRMGHL